MIEDMLQRRAGLHDVVYRAEQCGVRGAVDGCSVGRGGDQADVVPAPQARLTLRAEGQPFLNVLPAVGKTVSNIPVSMVAVIERQARTHVSSFPRRRKASGMFRGHDPSLLLLIS
jgi:hypothetical protein